jgi:hypothetical protein
MRLKKISAPLRKKFRLLEKSPLFFSTGIFNDLFSQRALKGIVSRKFAMLLLVPLES